MSAGEDRVTQRLRHLALATSGLAAAIALWPRTAASDRTPAAGADARLGAAQTAPAIARPPAARPQLAPAAKEPVAAERTTARAEPVAAERTTEQAEPPAAAMVAAQPVAAPPSAGPVAPARRPAPNPSPRESPSRGPARPSRAPLSGAPDAGAGSALAPAAPDPAAGLARALASRGLSLSEVSAMADVQAELERFQRQPSPERLPELLAAVDAAEIPTALLRQKLDRLGEKLRRAAPRLSPRDLELAERAYLDLETSAQSNPSRGERHALLTAAARLSARLD